MNELKSWLQSSQDPTTVANKVKGAILFASSIIILIAGHVFHITLTANDVLMLATEIGTIAGAIWGVYGAILHLITWMGSKKVE